MSDKHKRFADLELDDDDDVPERPKEVKASRRFDIDDISDSIEFEEQDAPSMVLHKSLFQVALHNAKVDFETPFGDVQALLITSAKGDRVLTALKSPNHDPEDRDSWSMVGYVHEGRLVGISTEAHLSALVPFLSYPQRYLHLLPRVEFQLLCRKCNHPLKDDEVVSGIHTKCPTQRKRRRRK